MPVPTTDIAGSAGSTPRSSSSEEAPREVEIENGSREESPTQALVQVNGDENDEGATRPK